MMLIYFWEPLSLDGGLYLQLALNENKPHASQSPSLRLCGLLPLQGAEVFDSDYMF